MSDIEFALPECEKGLGKVITAPDSAGLIDGVRLRSLELWADARGYFLEVLRMGQGLMADYPFESTQVAAAFNYPGAIKAFH